MAKGIGLIGNFRGKVGNMVGYNLKDSNNKQTQGVRVYQPVVKNPKTYGQAEQRAKLAPINATYRALKAIIDRGQEGKAYGNKSRLAWLSAAMLAFNGAWFEKGAVINQCALVPLSKGSLPNLFPLSGGWSDVKINVTGVSEAGTTTIGALSTALVAAFPQLKSGDQITFIKCGNGANGIDTAVVSIEIDTTSSESIPSGLTVGTGTLTFEPDHIDNMAAAIILSREGDGGQHLRSTTSLVNGEEYNSDLLADAAKEAAIKSYMAAGANTDWAEESLQ